MLEKSNNTAAQELGQSSKDEACLCPRCRRSNGRAGVNRLLEGLDVRRLMSASGSLDLVEMMEKEGFESSEILTLQAETLNQVLNRATAAASGDSGLSEQLRELIKQRELNVPVTTGPDAVEPVIVNQKDSNDIDQPTPDVGNPQQPDTQAPLNAIVVQPGQDVHAALAQAQAQGVGLHLSAGVYDLDRPLDITSAITITGDGNSTALTIGDRAAWAAEFGNAAIVRVAKQFTDHVGLTLRDLSIEGGFVGLGTTGSGMHWSTLENVRFRHLDIAMEASGVGNTFRDVTFQNNKTHVVWNGESTATRFERCTFTAASGDWALEIRTARQLTFDGCVFEANKTSEGTISLAGSRQVTFRDAWFENNGLATGNAARAGEIVTSATGKDGGVYGLTFQNLYFDPITSSRRPNFLRANTPATSVTFRDTNGNFRGSLFTTGTHNVLIEGLSPPINVG